MRKPLRVLVPIEYAPDALAPLLVGLATLPAYDPRDPDAAMREAAAANTWRTLVAYSPHRAPITRRSVLTPLHRVDIGPTIEPHLVRWNHSEV